jgi:hypothetical protein
MSFRGFTTPDMVSVSGPWATEGHPERLALLALSSMAGMVRFVDGVHSDVLAVLTDDERARLGLLTDGLVSRDDRHDNRARVAYYTLVAHQYLHGNTPAGVAIAEVRAVLYPENLNIVRASYRESAGMAAARIAQLTPERTQVLADIPVQGGNLLQVVQEWNRLGLELGDLQNQRVTPLKTPDERLKRRTVRARWIRTVKTMMGSLELEAQDSAGARRILERVAGIQAEVRRRTRASNGNATDGTPPGDDDNELDDIDDELGAEPGEELEAPPASAIERR